MIETTIYFVRHGQKEKKPGDPPLTPKGIKQAQETALFFSNLDIQSIYSSPYIRTKQTADIIAKQFQLPVITNDRLKERLNWGDRNNESFKEFWNEWQKTDLDRNYKPKNGNSSFKTGNEVKQFIEELPLTNRDHSVIIVTHGGTIGDFLRVVIPDKNLPHIINKETGAKYLEVLECSITIIEKMNGNYILKKINFTNHLNLEYLLNKRIGN